MLEASDDASEIPDGLHASLLARLDRLEDAKEIAQLGSVVGREFSYRLLAAVAKRPLAEIEAALERLVRSQLVFRKGLPPEVSYTFKHALVQDTAYDSLLKSRRQDLHGRIAETLETEFPEIVSAEPETLARHFEEAGAVARAIDYWEQAAHRNLARFAQAEAAEQLRNAVSLAAETASRRRPGPPRTGSTIAAWRSPFRCHWRFRAPRPRRHFIGPRIWPDRTRISTLCAEPIMVSSSVT